MRLQRKEKKNGTSEVRTAAIHSRAENTSTNRAPSREEIRCAHMKSILSVAAFRAKTLRTARRWSGFYPENSAPLSKQPGES
jgi:hypothetical protein